MLAAALRRAYLYRVAKRPKGQRPRRPVPAPELAPVEPATRATPTTVRMDGHTLARLEAIAASEERSISYVIFRLVLRGLRGYDEDGRLT